MNNYSPERLEYLRVRRKIARDAAALEAGRVPGRIGQPPKPMTPERVAKQEAYLKAKRRRALDRRSAKRAERAIAEGRIPGKPGTKKVLTTPDLIKESERARQARFREKHRDRLRERDRGLSAAKWAKLRNERPHEYKIITIANAAKQRALRESLKTPRGLTAIVRQIWCEQEGKCAVCASSEDLELDHILAVRNGGTNAADNLQFLCKPCNRSKGAKDFDAWLESRNDLERIAA